MCGIKAMSVTQPYGFKLMCFGILKSQFKSRVKLQIANIIPANKILIILQKFNKNVGIIYTVYRRK